MLFGQLSEIVALELVGCVNARNLTLLRVRQVLPRFGHLGLLGVNLARVRVDVHYICVQFRFDGNESIAESSEIAAGDGLFLQHPGDIRQGGVDSVNVLLSVFDDIILEPGGSEKCDCFRGRVVLEKVFDAVTGDPRQLVGSLSAWRYYLVITELIQSLLLLPYCASTDAGYLHHSLVVGLQTTLELGVVARLLGFLV